MLLLRVTKDSFINMDNVTEIQFTKNNVTFIHIGGHVKASVTTEDVSAQMKQWILANCIDPMATGLEDDPEGAPVPLYQPAAPVRQAAPAQAPPPRPAKQAPLGGVGGVNISDEDDESPIMLS